MSVTPTIATEASCPHTN